MDYYDTVLALIPLSVGGISVALLWSGFTMPVAVSAGALVAAGLIGHGMFIRTPTKASAVADTPPSHGHARQSTTREYETAD